MKHLIRITFYLIFSAAMAHASDLEGTLGRAEQLADLTNGFASRCENDIELEKTADTEDCDNFLKTYALWAEADDTFQSRYSLPGQAGDEDWKDNNVYRLKAYKHLINRLKRTAIKIDAMIQEIM